MNSNLGTEAPDDRALFEQAKAKLEEAFALLQSLEGRIEAEKPALARNPIDAAQRAEEREQLLAYVEHAQSEAMRLARRSRRLSRIRGRAKAQADLQRSVAIADEPTASQVGPRPGEISSEPTASQVGPRPGESTTPAASQVGPRSGEIITEPTPALESPVPTLLEANETTGALDPIERAFMAASRELSERVEATRELSPERVNRSRADTLIGPYTDLADEDLDISDAELHAFEESMAKTMVHTRIEWWPARAEAAESEKAGARRRRDRSPTERMERPTVVPPPFYARYVSMRAAAIAVAVLIAIVGGAVWAIRGVDESRSAAGEEEPYEFVGPPGELMQVPGEGGEVEQKQRGKGRNGRGERGKGRGK